MRVTHIFRIKHIKGHTKTETMDEYILVLYVSHMESLIFKNVFLHILHIIKGMYNFIETKFYFEVCHEK